MHIWFANGGIGLGCIDPRFAFHLHGRLGFVGRLVCGPDSWIRHWRNRDRPRISRMEPKIVILESDWIRVALLDHYSHFAEHRFGPIRAILNLQFTLVFSSVVCCDTLLLHGAWDNHLKDVISYQPRVEPPHSIKCLDITAQKNRPKLSII